MIKPQYQQIQSALSRKGYRFFERPGYDLNLIGIRKTGATDLFDETLVIAYRDPSGKRLIEYFPLTTEPGLKSLLSPINKAGTAIIAEGQYRGVWALATPQTGVRMHNSKIPCLRQIGRFLVYRDNNKNRTIEYNPKTRKWFTDVGLNLHPYWGSRSRIEKVGLWSAGCQVVGAHLDSDEYKRILELCELQIRFRHGNSFTYTLINEADFLD